MAGHVFPSRDGSNAGDSTTHAIDHNALRRAFNRTAVVIIALIVAVAMGLSGVVAPEAQAYDANGEGVTDQYLGCAANGNGGAAPTEIPYKGDKEKTDIGLTVTGYTRNEQGQYDKFVASNVNAPGTTIDLKNGNATINGLAANQPMSIDISVNMANPHEILGNVAKVPTDWVYKLPFKYSDIADASKSIVRYPLHGDLQGYIQIVRGCGDDDTAYIRVNYDDTWLADQPQRLGFQFSADIQLKNVSSGSSGGTQWQFPGVDQTFDVEWAKVYAPGSKRCYGTTENGDDYKCEVSVDAEADLQNFRFYDKSTGMIINTGSVMLDGQPISVGGAGTDNGNAYDFSYTANPLTSGSHNFVYTAKTDPDNPPVWNESTRSYDGTFKNEAWWNWDNGTETKVVFNPDYEVKPGGNGGGGSEDHKTNIFKNSEVPEGSDLIKWTIGVNSSNQHDIGGYQVTDTLHGKHDYVFGAEHPLTINVKNEQGQWVAYTQFPGSDSKGTFSHDEHSDTFSYTFPEDAGEHEYQLVYYTQPEKKDGVSIDMSVSNDASVCNPDDCDATKGTTGTTADIRGPIKPRVWKNNVQTTDGDHPWQSADGEVKPYPGNGKFLLVPWSVVFDPSEELQVNPDNKITNLELKEDWVNAHSDGNTLHMWYSADTIDLKIYTQDASGNWNRMPANSYTLTGNYDGNKELPNTGTTYPEPWFDENDNKTGGGQTDNNTLHKGVPRIKIRFNNTSITGPVKIVYNTIFDRMPDTYVNYATFHYDLNGRGYDTDYVSTHYVYADKETLQAGKATDVDHFGKDYWDNKAAIKQCANVDSSGAFEENAECFETNWTVWANGPKPWGQPTTSDPQVDYWDSGISGALDLKNVTFSDTLPDGWKLVPGSLKAIVLTPTYENGKVTTVDRYATIKDPSKYFTQNGQTFTVKIDDVNEALADATCSIQGADVACPTDLADMRKMIKFEYSTYLPYADAVKGGYQRGDLKTYVNNATLNVDGKGAAVQGETVIYKAEKDEGVLDKQLTQNASAGSSVLKYKIEINKKVNSWDADYTGTDFFKNNGLQQITLTDTLSPLGEYVPNSLRVKYIFSNGNKNGVDYKPSVTYTDKDGKPATSNNMDKWKLLREDGTYDENSASMPAGWTKAVTRDPDTGAQSLTVTIPKEWRMVNDQDGEWNSSTNSRDLLYGTLAFNDHVGVELSYEVQVNGLPGQTLQGFSNTAQLRGETTWDDETSENVVIPSLSGSVWQTVTPKIKKTDANTGAALAGAQFSLQQIDLSSFYDDSGALKTGDALQSAAKTLADKINDGYTLDFTDVKWMQPFTERGILYLQSGSDGVTMLPSMYEVGKFDYTNTLFLLNETRAPSGYELTTKDVYMVPIDTSASAQTRLNNLVTILDAVNANIKLAKNKIMPLYPDVNNRLTFTNDKITDVTWGKVAKDEGKMTIGDSTNPTLIKDPLYLNGSVWKIETTNSSDPEEEPICAEGTDARNGLLPCTVYVRDNGDTDGLDDDKWYVPDVDKATGMIMVRHLKRNVTYTLTEKTAPEGYIKSDEMYQFTIDDDGNTTWSGGHLPYMVVDDAGPTGIRVIGNQPEPKVVLPSAGGGTINNLLLSGLALVAGTLMFGMWYVNSESRSSARGRRARV